MIQKHIAILKHRELQIQTQPELDNYRKSLKVGQKMPSNEVKVLLKMSDMLMPYNSFFGISNDLKCESNKNLIFSIDEVM